MSTQQGHRGSVAYHSGNVFTAERDASRAEAFIVSEDGVFAAVGSNSEILDVARREQLPTFDLKSQFVMPGIHDAHVHILLGSLSSSSYLQPGMDASMSNIAARLKSPECACEHAHVFGDWVVGSLYRIDDFDREALDRDYPDTPVLLRGGAGHAMFMNTAALKRSGYSLTEPDAPHEQYFRRPDGSLTGEVTELAMTKAALAFPKPEASHVKRSILEGIGRLHSVGVTSFQEAASNTAILNALRELDAAGELKMDVQTHIVYKPEQLAEESFKTLHKTLDDAASFQSAHVQTNFVKFMLDGVPLHPYYTHAGLTDSGEIDESKIQIEDLAEAVAKFDARGMTCKIHCTGHGSTRRALDVYEAVRKSNRAGPRHEVAHCSGVHDDDYPRFKQLNVTAEMSPSIFFVHPITSMSSGLMDWNFGKMLKHGAHLTIGSDWAFQDPAILPACALILDSVASALPDAPDAKSKAAEVICRILTAAGAAAVGRESTTGTIGVGKKANFILVDHDLGKGDFDGAQVLGTWFEGVRVFDAKRSDG
ncbi:hydrolase [Cladophialophora carrionii]|uniref:Hydrolase n=1 Tax=Cladophialophora carrionii TaxID=86049 RepID=A0A1C1CUC6_9EURO|nr:hydrolase [Cladophialophora carrionii]